MEVPLQIKFLDISPSDAIEADIREKADKLGTFYDRITKCRVVISAPHQHHNKGKGFHIRIDIKVPGKELVINRDPGINPAHEDVYVAIRDAFDAARRQLQDYTRRQRGDIKAHEPVPYAQVAKLFPEHGYGFIETHDGREIYFHRNSVVKGGFDRIKVGAQVTFVEEQGNEGPQASTVKVVE